MTKTCLRGKTRFYPRWYVCTTRVYVLLCCCCSCSCSCCSCGHITQNTAYFIEFHHAILARALLPRQVQTWQNFAEFRHDFTSLTFALFLFSEYCIFDQFHILHAALDWSLAWQPCPSALAGSLARQPCPAALSGSLAEILTGRRPACIIAYWYRWPAGSSSAVYSKFFTQTRVRTEVIFSLVLLASKVGVLRASHKIFTCIARCR
jgi:hypothetical protein